MSNQEIVEYLKKHDFFSSLSEDSLQFLGECATTQQLKEDEVLFHMGERADKFYVVIEGGVSIQIPAVMGPTLELQVQGKDQVLGWSWLISPYKWNFQARARQDTQLLEFDGSAILERCERHPEFGYQMFKRFAGLMSARLDAARQKMMDEWNPAGFA